MNPVVELPAPLLHLKEQRGIGGHRLAVKIRLFVEAACGESPLIRRYQNSDGLARNGKSDLRLLLQQLGDVRGPPPTWCVGGVV